MIFASPSFKFLKPVDLLDFLDGHEPHYDLLLYAIFMKLV